MYLDYQCIYVLDSSIWITTDKYFPSQDILCFSDLRRCCDLKQKYELGIFLVQGTYLHSLSLQNKKYSSSPVFTLVILFQRADKESSYPDVGNFFCLSWLF